jgi:hypothetical protein
MKELMSEVSHISMIGSCSDVTSLLDKASDDSECHSPFSR